MRSGGRCSAGFFFLRSAMRLRAGVIQTIAATSATWNATEAAFHSISLRRRTLSRSRISSAKRASFISSARRRCGSRRP